MDLVLILLNVCYIFFTIIMQTIFLINIFMLLCVSLRLALLLPSSDSLLSLACEGILLHIVIGVSQSHLDYSRFMCIISYVIHLNQDKPLCYCGRTDTPYGAATPNGVSSNWDFTLGRHMYVGGIQHRQRCGTRRRHKWQVVPIESIWICHI